MQGIPRPVLVITRRSTAIYPSIKEAAEALGVSQQRVLRAMESEEGELKGMPCKVFVDDPLPIPKDQKTE